ncbi:Rieske (2Fe-2S) protein [Nocardioides sediminis]|uniref:Rieske (2Fe-2S) protein n=1 Tax=Nocardioides sediminis TaxID=433648 RepID=UPI000D2F8E97|nr:Rieske (2Fe-2S) protein [Nocardioides sediminis]
MSTEHPLTRRRFTATATAGLALPVLAACGSDDGGTAADSSSAEPSDASSSPAEDGAGGATGAVLASTSDVPVGGCAVFESEKVVVTQPTEGEFKAFSSTCTHQGCAVSSSSDGEIPCNCHGSRFSLEDGSVLNGPATAPLDEVAITVEGDSITLA